MKKKLSVILHHNVQEELTIEHKLTRSQMLSRVFFKLVNFIVAILYWIGLAIISLPKLPRWIFEHTKSMPRGFSFQKSISFAVLVVIALTPVLLFKTASEGQRLGGRVLGLSHSAITDVSEAKDAISNQDYIRAQTNFNEVLTQLKLAQAELDQSSLVLQSIVKLSPDSYNTEHVLKAAQVLTESAALGSELLGAIDQVRLSPEGLSHRQGQPIKETIENFRDSSLKISAKLHEANELLAPLNTEILPAEYQSVLKDSQELVAELSKQTESLGMMATIFSDLLLGEKRFLVVLQNNNELRPTGGFIGTIGQGYLTDGSIKKLDIRTVYDPDGQILEWIKPPIPLQAVNNRLFLRDSNWFANFPDSAQTITSSYERCRGETPDVIMAITPDVFISLLNMTGPIYLSRYNVTISSSNFIEQIQTSTSLSYDKELNQPKQLLADLYPALLQRVAEASDNNTFTLLNFFQENLVRKDILLFSRNEKLQHQFETFNWAGKLNPTDRDYLHLNLTNLSGTKTDRFLQREVILTTTIEEDGDVINQLSYTVINPLPNDPGLSNRSFLRALVPAGSKLLAGSGFYSFEMPPLADNVEYRSDTQVDQWNSSVSYMDNYQVWSGQESGKAFFGGWVEVNGGESKTVTLTYQLPFKLNKRDRYSLLLEKQSGLLPYDFQQYLVYPGRAIAWDNLRSDSRNVHAEGGFNLNWDTTLSHDNFIGAVFVKND